MSFGHDITRARHGEAGVRVFGCWWRILASPLVAVVCHAALGTGIAPHLDSAEAIQYRFTFPEPEHRWMQVEAVFSDLPEGVLELRMSRSSPGRYSIHDFAKNVYDVHAYGRDGGEIATTRPDAYGWNVSDHKGRVTVRYRVYGDHADGTYLAVDTTHAHINMPAAILWARGLGDWPATLTFVPPSTPSSTRSSGMAWQVATQLHRGQSAYEFTAPNLAYLMDSPVEFGPLTIRQFVVGARTFRFAVHHRGTDAELDDYLEDVEKVVRQEGAVFGEFPDYEPGYYTFLADYLPYVVSDGMEHRNSTVMTSTGSIRNGRRGLLETVSHEFFHSWNVERIRPRSLEPFDLENANASGELWLAEGFTQYYGTLLLQRAGLADLRATADAFGELVDAVAAAPGRLARSAEEMSRMAPFVDGGRPVDRTNWSATYTSYYPLGGAIALALDLTLRERSEGRVTLDDFMRAMWRVHGKPGGAREGEVDHPYTPADAEARLADVTGDPLFAREFFERFIRGRDVPDYARLLAVAGFTVRKHSPGRAWWGDVRLEAQGGRLLVTALVSPTSPAYTAGLEQDDELRQIDGTRVHSPDEVGAIVQRRKPGDVLRITYLDRTEVERTTTVTLTEDPRLDVLPVESAGGRLTTAQRQFRDRWLSAR